MSTAEVTNQLSQLAASASEEIDSQRRLLPRQALGVGGVDLAGLSASVGQGTVSVVMSVYGDFSTSRLEAVLASLGGQECVAETIVAEQLFEGQRARAGEAAADFGAIHVLDVLKKPVQGPLNNNPGRARNAGIRASSSEWLYLSDADVVFPGNSFFRALLEASTQVPDAVWMRPAAVHVPEQAQRESATSLRNLPSELPRPLPFFWPPLDGDEVPVTTLHRGKRYAARSADFASLQSDRERWAGFEPLVWQSRQHDGGIFCRRALVQVVAGYSEVFVRWGGEDADLQWKLSELFTPVSLAAFEGLFVYHLDHPRSWVDRISWERNRLLLEKRTNRGVLASIIDDVLTGLGPYHAELRESWRWPVPLSLEAEPA